MLPMLRAVFSDFDGLSHAQRAHDRIPAVSIRRIGRSCSTSCVRQLVVVRQWRRFQMFFETVNRMRVRSGTFERDELVVF
jgi:hypothetical protein